MAAPDICPGLQPVTSPHVHERALLRVPTSTRELWHRPQRSRQTPSWGCSDSSGRGNRKRMSYEE